MGFACFVGGIAMGVLAEAMGVRIAALALEALGASILFPIMISLTYDTLRERWLGDEVWRVFGEFADAGITRIYRDREASASADNAQNRLSAEFKTLGQGDVLMMGVSLRVFFNPLGPFYRDIATMLESGAGRVTVQALICDPDGLEAQARAAVEEPLRGPDEKPQIARDIESSIATVRTMAQTVGPRIRLRQFVTAPYCTAVIFPDIAYFSPNILAHEAPVRLPMILFRRGSHGYRVLRSSFEYLWSQSQDREVTVSPLPSGGNDLSGSSGE